MEKNLLEEEKISMSTQAGAPGPVAWAFPAPTGVVTCRCQTTGMDSTITTEPSQVMGLLACLTGCRAQPGDGLVCVFDGVAVLMRELPRST